MPSKLTVLFAPVDAVGHVNACIGLAEALRDRGHRIVFVVGKPYAGKLSPYGFEEEIFESEDPKSESQIKNAKPGEHAATSLKQQGLFSEGDSLAKLKRLVSSPFFPQLAQRMIAAEPKYKQIVDKYKPDISVIDNFIGSPSLTWASGKPWVFLWSGNPLIAFSDDERLPPACSGCPASDNSRWDEFRQLNKQLFAEANKICNTWLKENGHPTGDPNKSIPESPHLNLYGYPEELDYTDIRPVPEKWFRIDSFMRKGEQEFTLPEKFKDRNEIKEKVIYLSLGSMGSSDVELMKRLVSILSKSSHKFIVSKGLLGDSYQLADNMWGEKSVPQTKVLPLVDLVITHGGNNTVTETFSCGKPMIVMPLFADQFDNAQRIQEKGFGVRLDPYRVSEHELLDTIDRLLGDDELRHKLQVSTNRIASSDSLAKAVRLVEQLVKQSV